MKTLTFAAGAAIGYVLGARAGREKYQQIVDGTRTITHKPAVQQAQSKIKDLVGQGTTAVSHKLGAGSDDTDATTASFDSAPTVTTRSTSEKAATSTPAPLTDTTS